MELPDDELLLTIGLQVNRPKPGTELYEDPEEKEIMDSPVA